MDIKDLHKVETLGHKLRECRMALACLDAPNSECWAAVRQPGDIHPNTFSQPVPREVVKALFVTERDRVLKELTSLGVTGDV